MEFCPKCGKLLKADDNDILVCSECGFKKTSDGGSITVEEIKKKKSDVVVSEGKTALPKTEEECPECGFGEAYYWMEQTRSADEAPTRFYKCVKCGHIWREYS